MLFVRHQSKLVAESLSMKVYMDNKNVKKFQKFTS